VNRRKGTWARALITTKGFSLAAPKTKWKNTYIPKKFLAATFSAEVG